MTDKDLDAIRQIVREEIKEALNNPVSGGDEPNQCCMTTECPMMFVAIPAGCSMSCPKCLQMINSSAPMC